MAAYYNEHDSYAAQWLRNLIKAGHLPAGDVDERSIVDVVAGDVAHYTQRHWFAGIGGWGLALRIARWEDSRPVVTGSAPCQPFSQAGKRRSTDDERHLWPHMFRIERELRCQWWFGEQVGGSLGYGWLDGVCADMEAEGYTVEAVDIPACSISAPHIRSRIYWIAQRLSNGEGIGRRTRPDKIIALGDGLGLTSSSGGDDGGLPDAERAPRRAQHEQDAGERTDCEPGDGAVSRGGGEATGPDRLQDAFSIGCTPRRASEPRRAGGPALASNGSDDAQQLGFAFSAGSQGHPGDGDESGEPRRIGEGQDGSAAEAGSGRRVCLADTGHGLVSEPRRGPKGRDGSGPTGARGGGSIAVGQADSPSGGLGVLREPSRRDGQPDRRDPGAFWADFAIVGPDPKGKYRRVGRRLQTIEEITQGRVISDVRLVAHGVSVGLAGMRSGEDSQTTEGWGTPRANTAGGVPTEHTGRGSRLEDQAGELHGWSSPTAVDGRRGCEPSRPHDTGEPLSQQVVSQDGTSEHLPLLEVGVPARVGKLRGFGNAIVPGLAATVIMAFMESG